MKKLLLVSLCFLMAFATQVYAQNRTVTGTVTSTEDGLPLPGVTVSAVGTSTGTQTDLNGRFSLSVPSSATQLQFSFVGYATQTLAINSSGNLTVRLSQDSKALSEVVVVGYGAKSVREQNGAIGHVKGEDIAAQPAGSFDKALSGKTAGVQISSAGGTLADGVSVRVRGVNSISSSSLPLFIVDGVPMNSVENLSLFNGGNGTRFNPLALINPDDIESIDVLKDAGASAIYGSRASNGVVIVTTKKGKKGQTIITLDSKQSWASPSRRPNLLGAEDFKTINNEKVRNQPAFGAAANTVVAVDSDIDGDGQPDRTDWMKLLYKTGFSTDNNLSFRGGSEKATYFASARFVDQKGIIFGNTLQQAQARTNIELTPNKYVKAGVQLAYSRSYNQGVLTDAYLAGAAISGINAFPTVSPYNPNGSTLLRGLNITGTGAKEGFGYLGLGNNILAVGGTSLIGNRIYHPMGSMLGRNDLTPENITANGFVEVTPIPGLKFTSKYGVDLLKNFEDQYSPPTIAGLGVGYAGLVQDYFRTRNQAVWQNFINFDKSFGDHRVSATLGSEYTFLKEQQIYASANNFADPFFTSIIDGAYSGIDPSSTSGALLLSSGGNIFTNGIESYFGRASYAFKDKYTIEGTVRRDAFSGFGDNFRWGTFPSFSAGWVVSEEDFLKDNKYISYLKIKGSWGKVGNMRGVGSYAARTLYSGGLYAALNGFSSSQLGNADLRWEAQNQTDIGFSLGVLGNKITLDVDYFNNSINQLILAAPVLYTVGVPGSSITTNIGSMRNRGIEVTINSKNIRTADFGWTTSFNYTFVKNTVLSLVPPLNADIAFGNTWASVGRPLGVYKLLRNAGINPNNGYAGWYDAAGNIKEYNQATRSWTIRGGGATTAIGAADQVFFEGKTGTPTWYGGLDNTLTYKQFDFNFSFVYSGGNYLYNTTFQGLLTNNFQNNDARIMNRWTTAGQVTDIPRVNSLDVTSNQGSDRFLEKGDFLRSRVISLGYRVPKALVSKVGMSDLRISAQVYNAFVITGYSGVDPEVNSTRNNNNSQTGIDNRAIPQPRTYTLGLTASF